MKTTKWAAQTIARIERNDVPEPVIRKMRQILARAINHGEHSWMTGTPSCNASDAERMLALVEQRHCTISAEQSRKGADWLFKNAFTSKGLQRRTEFAQQFSAQDLQVIRDCHASPRFDLVGFYDTREHGERYCTLFPVYRCHGANGAWFDYAARAWQSGGNSFVLQRS